MVALRLRNVVPEMVAQFQVYYSFSTLALLQKPLLLSSGERRRPGSSARSSGQPPALPLGARGARPVRLHAREGSRALGRLLLGGGVLRGRRPAAGTACGAAADSPPALPRAVFGSLFAVVILLSKGDGGLRSKFGSQAKVHAE